MQLDRTLLVFDYLNGEPVARLERGVADPIGPSGAAAAFDREAFLAAGGFDENLFAYWEDVDLVLRMRLEGARCALAPSAARHPRPLGHARARARARKNYLTGFGRGYVLRKWGVLASPRRLAQVWRADGAICLGQAVVDRTSSGIRGRVQGLRRATPAYGFPAPDPGRRPSPAGRAQHLRQAPATPAPAARSAAGRTERAPLSGRAPRA